MDTTSFTKKSIGGVPTIEPALTPPPIAHTQTAFTKKLKLGAAKKEAGKAYGLLTIHTPTKDQPVTPQTFHFALDRKKLRIARRREGGYLLRSNIRGDDPGHLWRLYLQLVEIDIDQTW